MVAWKVSEIAGPAAIVVEIDMKQSSVERAALYSFNSQVVAAVRDLCQF